MEGFGPRETWGDNRLVSSDINSIAHMKFDSKTRSLTDILNQHICNQETTIHMLRKCQLKYIIYT